MSGITLPCANRLLPVQQTKETLVNEKGNVFSSAAEVAVVSLMATSGIFMAAIPWPLVVSLLAIIPVFLFLIDGLKIALRD